MTAAGPGERPRPGNWGRWGADDQLGAYNILTGQHVLDAVALVRTGLVVPLGQVLGPKTLVPPHRKQVERFMTRDGGDYAAGARRPGGFQFAEEVVSFAAHSGTHIDALSHAWSGDLLYNGHPSTAIRSTTGAAKCGAENLRPVVTRGVLIDMVAQRGRGLTVGETIGADDLDRTLTAAGVSLRAGDAVLIRTGWEAMARSDPEACFEGEPGISADAALWLAARDVVLVGADNYAVEVQPSPPGTGFPAHQVLIRDHGIPLIEGLLLDELSGTGRAEFLLACVPSPVVGGTAAQVCPIAIL
jgi:kynurenine formamidase